MFLKKKKTAVLVLLFSVIAVCILSAASLLVREHNFELAKEAALEALAELDGEYYENTISLYNTTPARANEIAQAVGATVRPSDDGKFAVLTLKHGTIEDVYTNNEYRKYVSEMSANFKVYLDGYDKESGSYITMDGYMEGITDGYYTNGSQKYLQYMNVGDTWAVTKGAGTTLVIIDSGIDTDHVDFIASADREISYDLGDGKGTKTIISDLSYNASLEPGKRLVKDNGYAVIDDTDQVNQYIIDENGNRVENPMYEKDHYSHGTGVAGVMVAQHNGKGIVGIAPDADLIFVRCITEGGNFQSADLEIALAYINEIYAEEENGFDDFVVNMSFGASGATTASYASQFKTGTEMGITFVSSAGNESVMTSAYPSCDPYVIGVGSITNAYMNNGSAKMSAFSNYGPNTCEVFAPGEVMSCNIHGGWETTQGTSFSCPIMVGAIGLYLSMNPGDKLEDIREVLHASCDDMYDGKSPDGYDKTYCYGTLNLEAFVLGEQIEITYEYNMEGYEKTSETIIKGHTFQCNNRPSTQESIFFGWYYDANCENEVIFTEDVFDSALTVYAKWEKLENIPMDKLYSYKVNTDNTVQITSVLYNSVYCNIPETINGMPVTDIGGQAFQNSDFAHITIPETVTSIGSYAFSTCTNLEEIVIPDSVVTVGNYAFNGCSALKSITIGKNVTSIGANAFNECIYVTKIEYNAVAMDDFAEDNQIFYKVGQGDQFKEGEEPAGFDRSQFGFDLVIGKDVTKIPAYLFNPYGNNQNVVPRINNVVFEEGSVCNSIGAYAFYYVRSIKSVTITSPEVAIGAHAFETNPNAKFDIQGVVTSLGECAFQGCDSLESIRLGEKIINIAANTFANCKSLRSVLFSASVVEIKDYAFSGCESLESLYLPSTVKKLGTLPFYNCKNLTIYTDVTEGEYKWCTEGNTAYTKLLSNIKEIRFHETFNRVEVKMHHTLVAEYLFDLGATVTVNPADFNLQNVHAIDPTVGIFTFTGEWDVDGDGKADTLPMEADGNLTIQGIFTIEAATYTITFLDEDENVIKTYTASYGDVIECPAVPEKEYLGTGDYYYKGTWVGYTEGMTVTGDATFKPKYTKTKLPDGTSSDSTSSDSSTSQPSAGESSGTSEEKSGCGVVSFGNFGGMIGGGTLLLLSGFAIMMLRKKKVN